MFFIHNPIRYVVTVKKYVHKTRQHFSFWSIFFSREIWLKSFSNCLENQSNVNEFWEINDVLLFSQGGYINPFALLAKYVPTKLIQLMWGMDALLGVQHWWIYHHLLNDKLSSQLLNFSFLILYDHFGCFRSTLQKLYV